MLFAPCRGNLQKTYHGIFHICLQSHHLLKSENKAHHINHSFHWACSHADSSSGKYPADPIKWEVPAGWPKPANNIFTNNKLTEQGFQLGKKLFYDGILSKDGEISCA